MPGGSPRHAHERELLELAQSMTAREAWRRWVLARDPVERERWSDVFEICCSRAR